MTAPRRQLPLAVRLLATALGVALYALGGQVALPFVALPPGMEAPRWASVAALGIEPLVLGFGLAAVLALLVPQARLRLLRLALPLSLACAVVQAGSLVLRLEEGSAASGQPYLLDPHWAAWLAVAGTLAAATAALYLLGNALTAWGVGNGFCLFFLVSIVYRLNAYLEHPPGRRPIDGWTFVFLAVAALGTGLYLRRERRVLVTAPAAPAVAVPLPPFPQSIVPLLAAYWIFQTLAHFRRLPRFLAVNLSAQVVALALVVALVGLLTFAQVGRRRRLLADLPAGAEIAAGEPDPWRLQFLLATAFLCGGVAVYPVVERYAGVQAALLPFSFLLPLVALVLDLADGLRFLGSHPVAQVAAFGDLAVAAYWRGRLAERGIPALLEAGVFRGLYSRFLPLVEIDLLVPAERLDEARALLAPAPPIPPVETPPEAPAVEDATADRSPDS